MNNETESLAEELYFKDIQHNRRLTMEEEHALISRLQNKKDRNALEALIEANARFAAGVAISYRNRGVPVIDLIQEGNKGMMKAAYRFNIKKEIKFISYAVWWIEQSIRKALGEQGKITNVPLNVISEAHRISKIVRKFEAKKYRTPEPEEILPLYVEKYEKQKNNNGNIGKITLEKIKRDLDILKKDIYFETRSDDSDELHNFDDANLSNENYADLLDVDTSHLRNGYNSDTKEELEYIINKTTFTGLEKEVIKLYHGINNEETALTFDEIGQMYNLTRERIRQIHDKGIERLKRSAFFYKKGL